MSERAYTVSEIDGLRRACENQWLWGSYSGPVFRGGSGASSRCYKEEEKTACVEQMVRTHMLAGHTAEDLLHARDRPDNWPISGPLTPPSAPPPKPSPKEPPTLS